VVISMADTRGWLIGLAIAAILAWGVVSWMNASTSSAGLPDASVDVVPLTAGEANSTGWGDAAPNFMAGDVEQEHTGGKGANWGRLTVDEVCEEQGVALDLAQSRLAAYGLTTEPSQTIRDLADAGGYKPSEVVDILLGEDPGAGCDDPDCDHDSDAGGGHGSHDGDDGACADEETGERSCDE
jgi:hypothetical protein